MASRRISSTDLDLYTDYNQASHRRGMSRHHRAENYAEPFGKENMQKATESAIDGGVAAAAAFGAGYYQGTKNGMPTLAGLGYDVWGALGLWGLGLFGESMLGGASRYVVAAGTGLASFAAGAIGAKMGCQHRASTPGTAPCGTPVSAAAHVDPRFGPYLPNAVVPSMTPKTGGGAAGWNYQRQYVR